jgi:hypothetical protein
VSLSSPDDQGGNNHAHVINRITNDVDKNPKHAQISSGMASTKRAVSVLVVSLDMLYHVSVTLNLIMGALTAFEP